MADLSGLHFDGASDTPLYKQLAHEIALRIDSGVLPAGQRLPPTRELAGQLGLNRTTVSAAYALLEQSALIEGHVGRGSFVTRRKESMSGPQTDWDAILSPADQPPSPSTQPVEISFANSRPSEDSFPLSSFRRLAKQAIDSADAAEILQLGSPHGHAPLRRYLLEEARSRGVARSGDDLIVTSGCQQALDLLARLFCSNGQSVALEDPVYHGLLRVFARAGALLLAVPLDDGGVSLDALAETMERHRPRLLVLTPSFQNPTGATLSLDRRKRIVNLAQRYGTVLVENDIYSELRYRGRALPPLKAIDETGNTILLGSYSKISFPGLRVGWVIAPRAVVARLADAKQTSDLHSDQLSQAVALRFAQSGELEKHLQKTRMTGAQRLDAVLRACARYLPPESTYTRPEGGMSLWVELPARLSAGQLLRRTEKRGVNFLPGRYFSVNGSQDRGLRISFGGLTPDEITRGIQIIGEAAREELAAQPEKVDYAPVPALV